MPIQWRASSQWEVVRSSPSSGRAARFGIWRATSGFLHRVLLILLWTFPHDCLVVESEQAASWLAAYRDGLPALENAASEMQGLMDRLRPDLRREARVSDLRVVTAGVTRMRARLDYWQGLTDRPPA